MTEKQRLINELIGYDFKCKAGTLDKCVHFKDLKRIIDEEATPALAVMPPLSRPLCFLDLETTGTEPDKDFIVEISILKLHPGGKEELKTHRINPGVPIPESATAVHGITNEMVKDAPPFVSISKSLLKFIEDCDIAGFNSNRFDVPMLFFMFDRCGLQWDWKKVNLIDVSNIFRINEARTLTAAVKFYLQKNHDQAHDAAGDVEATRQVLLAQWARYPDLPKKFEELALFSNYGRDIVDLAGKFVKNEAGEIVFTFGPHNGQPAKSQKGFLNWMMGKDFNKDTLNIARKIMLEE